ncbi:MAG: 2-hydroxyacid dehydrogenase [Tagaea sp.]|nr:2-hydroxyacid dehydrogenase [Tagaea sp.]
MLANRPKVMYFSHAGDDVYRLIRAAASDAFDVVTLSTDGDDERLARIAECEVVICAATPLRRKFIERAASLRLVHHQGVGWQDTIDWQVLKERGIPLALTPEGTTEGVAEHTILLMLAAAKRLSFADSELRAGRWHINALRGESRELAGKTIGYVGMGRIAQAVAERLAAFGCSGLYHDPVVRLAPALEARLGVATATFDEVLAKADVLTIHVPLTATTKGLIGPSAIARMKKGAILVNTARGGIVDETALAEALRSGHLLAAGLDVFETEPPASSNALLALPNAVLTPHISAGTRDAMERKMTAIFANIGRFYRGEPLANRVAAW